MPDERVPVFCDLVSAMPAGDSRLAADGGEQIQCGWLKDKFGMPWQIVPSKVWDWLRDDDPGRVQLVKAALWQMEKLDLAELRRAAGWGAKKD